MFACQEVSNSISAWWFVQLYLQVLGVMQYLVEIIPDSSLFTKSVQTLDIVEP